MHLDVDCYFKPDPTIQIKAPFTTTGCTSAALLLLHYRCASGLIVQRLVLSLSASPSAVQHQRDPQNSVCRLHIYWGCTLGCNLFGFQMNIFDSCRPNGISKAFLAHRPFQEGDIIIAIPFYQPSALVVSSEQCFFLTIPPLNVHNGLASHGSLHGKCTRVLQYGGMQAFLTPPYTFLFVCHISLYSQATYISNVTYCLCR